MIAMDTVYTPRNTRFLKEARSVKKGAPTIVHCEAAAREMVGCFLRNPGSATVNVRVRRRWWGLEDQRLPTEQEVHVEEKTLVLGGEIEMILSSERSAKGSIEIIPKSGTVSGNTTATPTKSLLASGSTISVESGSVRQ
jgi:hypothetical protein